MLYYIQYEGQTIGPMSAAQVAAYPVKSDTLVSAEGGEWQPLFKFPELMEVISSSPSDTGRKDSSMKVACGVLAILIGGLGLQYFLIGKTAGGLINIALAIVTCGIWSIVNLVQGIMILCMSEDDWNRKFVNSDSTFPIF